MKAVLSKLAPIFLAIASTPIMAQSLNFSTWSLESGTELAQDSVYRFGSVLTGVDALVTVSGIHGNAYLVQIDDSLGTLSDTEMAAFRPTVGGITNQAANTHYIDFNVRFVDSATGSAITISQFGLSIYDTDGDADLADFSDGQDGDVLEWAIVNGAQSRSYLGSMLTPFDVPGGFGVVATTSENNPDVTPAPGWLSSYDYDMVNELSLSLGWTGSDNLMNADNDRLYGSYFTGNSSVFPSVPEPGIPLFALSSIVVAVLRRRRH